MRYYHAVSLFAQQYRKQEGYSMPQSLSWPLDASSRNLGATFLLAYSPLSVVEPVHGDDLGLDPLPLALQLRLGLLGQAPLLLVVVEDGAHVLPAAARPGVVVLPEHLQQLGVGGHLKQRFSNLEQCD